LFSFCDNAESDFCGAAAPLPNEPNPPDGLDGGAAASFDAGRRLNDPKLPPGFDFDDAEDEDEDEDDDDARCDEKPLLNDWDGVEGLASTCASGTSSDSNKAT
jgi:hypothetical protein